MNLNQLRIFYDLALTESFRKLSAINGISIAKISRELAALENELGYKLIDRKSGRSTMDLTLQGQILFKALPQIFGIFDNLKQVMSTNPKLNKGDITLHTTNSLIEDWIVYMLPKLSKLYPNIQLNLIANNNLLTRDLKEKVISISPATNEKNKGYIQVPLLDFHVCLWAATSYLDQYGRPENINELGRHKLIFYTKDLDQMTYPNLNWHLKDCEINIDEHICINSTVAFIRAAELGLGIISLSEENIKAGGYKLEKVLPTIKGPTITMCLTYPTYWEKNSIIENLIDFFKKEFQTQNLKFKG